MTTLLTPPAVKLLTADEFAEQFAGQRMELVRGVPTMTPTISPNEPLAPDTAPRLVLEMLSPAESWIDVYRRVGRHLSAGVKVVVILDPRTETASVYRPDVVQETFRAPDDLTVPEVLPGFSVPVAKLFG